MTKTKNLYGKLFTPSKSLKILLSMQKSYWCKNLKAIPWNPYYGDYPGFGIAGKLRF